MFIPFILSGVPLPECFKFTQDTSLCIVKWNIFFCQLKVDKCGQTRLANVLPLKDDGRAERGCNTVASLLERNHFEATSCLLFSCWEG